MATSGIFYDNFLTGSGVVFGLTASGGAVAQSSAVISGVQTIRAAFSYATLEVQGTYTDVVETLYRVEIHVVGTGAFGSARWRWSDTGGQSWNASNLTTQNGTWVSLNRGIQVRFVGGAYNPQFALSDAWNFRVTLPYGPLKAADGSRNSEWRSGSVGSGDTVEWQIDLGTARSPTVFAILDENAQTVTLKGKATGFTDPPTYSQVIASVTSDRRMAIIAPGSFRYWRVTVNTSTTPALGYLRWSEIFLGTVGLFQQSYIRGFQRSRRRLGSVDLESVLAFGPGPYRYSGDVWSVRYEYLTTADQAILDGLWTGTNDGTGRLQRPFFWLPLDSNLADFQLVHWANEYEREQASLTVDQSRMHVPLEWAEVVRTLT